MRLCARARIAARGHRARLREYIERSAEAAKLRAALELVGRGLWRQAIARQAIPRFSARPRSLLHAPRGSRGRARLPSRPGPVVWFCAAGSGTNCVLALGWAAAKRAMRSRPGRLLLHDTNGARLSRGGLPSQSLDVDRPLSPLPADISARLQRVKQSFGGASKAG